MIDTHIHLDFESYNEDREQVISRFFAAGGQALINIGVDVKRIQETLRIAQKHERVYAAVGFHPQEAYDMHKATGSLDFVQQVKGFAQDKKVVAIGEIGLDYFHPSGVDYELKINDEIKALQKNVFVRQLEIARELKLPAIIHNWDSLEDCWEVMKRYSDIRMVIHCYGRGIPTEFTQEALTYENIYFSFTGNVTFPKPGKNGSEIWEHIKLSAVHTRTGSASTTSHRESRNPGSSGGWPAAAAGQIFSGDTKRTDFPGQSRQKN